MSASSHHSTSAPPLLPPPRNYLKLSQQSMNKPPRPLHAQSRKRKHDGSSPGGVTTHLLYNPLFGHPDHVASHFPSLDFCDDLEPVDASYFSGLSMSGGEVALSSVPLLAQTADVCPPLGLSGSVAAGTGSMNGHTSVLLPPLSLGSMGTSGTISLPSVTSASLLASSHLSQPPLPPVGASGSSARPPAPASASCCLSVYGTSSSLGAGAYVTATVATDAQARVASPSLILPFSTPTQESLSHGSSEDCASSVGDSKLPLLPHMPSDAPALLPQPPTALRSTSNRSLLSVDTPPPLPSYNWSGVNASVNNSFMTPERARAYEALYELSPNFESPPRYRLLFIYFCRLCALVRPETEHRSAKLMGMSIQNLNSCEI